MIALDANILLRIADIADPLSGVASAAFVRCEKRDRVVIFPQALFEFWAVATRARTSNGLEMTPELASQWVEHFKTTVNLLSDPADLVDRWHSLSSQHRVTGFRVHDTRYVAAMACHGVGSLLTFNIKHFKDYSIDLLDPAVVSISST